MRLGLIGDVHAEDERVKVALSAFATADIDRVLCTGDVVDGLGDIDRTCALLWSHGVLTIRGNHDRWIREDAVRTLPNAHRMTALATASVEFIKSLPATATLDVPGGKLLLCHGVGENDMNGIRADDSGYDIAANKDLCDILLDPKIVYVVGGHTHNAGIRRMERGAKQPPLVVVNAGTLARDGESGFAILDVESKRIDFHRIDADLTVRHASRAVF